ncbi:hypothetical protein [Spirosoma agri]|uniref:Uncharacterized protein n=1 Tax=Spirosoma agri TaxID=1987381 RepID=A0A6M0IBG4_9BACT|nr:hypothetical protein [Spirosoma agri]NEU65510.1 hypothetical protein [Spirosoma agri]
MRHFIPLPQLLFVCFASNQFSCQSKSQENIEQTTQESHLSSKNSVLMQGDYDARINTRWMMKETKLADHYGNDRQHSSVDILNRKFAHADFDLSNHSFSSVRVRGTRETVNDVISVTASQPDSFAIIRLNQRFKIIEVTDSILILQTLEGVGVPYDIKELADMSMASGGPYGFKNLRFTFEK